MPATGAPRCDISKQQSHTGWKPTIDYAFPNPVPGVIAKGKRVVPAGAPPGRELRSHHPQQGVCVVSAR